MNRAANARPGYRPSFQPDLSDFPALGSGPAARPPPPPPARADPDVQPVESPPQPIKTNAPPPPGLADSRPQILGALQGHTGHTPGVINLQPSIPNGLPRPGAHQPPQSKLPPPLPQPPSQPQSSAAVRAPTPPRSNFPQTNSQQVLISPADQWGLSGLIAVMRQARESELGFDMAQLGFDNIGGTGQGSPLHSSFISPFFPSSNPGAGLPSPYTEPSFQVPKVYPSGPKMIKFEAMTEEALFVLFYSAPRDALQEIAADGLHQKAWRYHKQLRLWLTREGGPTVKVPGGEQGDFTIFNVTSSDGLWRKETREMTVLYADLEERPYKGPEALNVLHDAALRDQKLKELSNQQHPHPAQSGGNGRGVY